MRNLTELAIDADRLLVQRMCLREVAGKQPGARKRAQAARPGLGYPERTYEHICPAHEALALIHVVRRQTRDARPQQCASLVEAVSELAIEQCGAHRLVVIGRLVQVKHCASLLD